MVSRGGSDLHFAKYLFRCLLAIYLSSLGKCLCIFEWGCLSPVSTRLSVALYVGGLGVQGPGAHVRLARSSSMPSSTQAVTFSQCLETGGGVISAF